jgi:hypothetical protein
MPKSARESLGAGALVMVVVLMVVLVVVLMMDLMMTLYQTRSALTQP